MLKERNYQLSKELLVNYQEAALRNAQELLEEASLLLEHSHYARAYFLALASLEETGKAQTAFDAQGRNLNDDGLCSKIKERLEDHSNKISSAFIAWMNYSINHREAVKSAIDLIIPLKRGREKSMYTDVKPDGVSLSLPSEIVRVNVANDCISVAANCLHHAKLHFGENKPNERDKFEDKLLCLKQGIVSKMLNTGDFWEFYLDQLEKGNESYAKSVVTYHDAYFRKDRKFKQAR